MSTRAQLKEFFETGDVPTEAQFADLIDSLLHLTEDTTDDLTEGASNKFFSAADETKLDGIEAGAQVNPTLVSQAEAEAGVATTARLWSALRVAQAIAALAGGGGSSNYPEMSPTVQSSGFTAVVGKIHPVDTAGGAVSISPPASPSPGDQFGITDARNSFSTNLVKINFNSAGQRFVGISTTSANFSFTKPGAYVFEYLNATYGWVLISGQL
jgi:hypothetical protein